MTLPAGARLGRYQIIELLGAGGMGMVYRARDERLQRDVAIKVLPPTVLSDDTARHRFRKEALALAKLSHPHIAAVYDVGEEGDTAYLVMECVAGESLAERLRRGPVTVEDAVRYGAQIAEALTEAHEHGVVHRDLKPANVMLTPKGQVKVLDFGLAKLLAPPGGTQATLSQSELGAPAGTPLYMSPEQAFGEVVDARTDLWSLGVILFETLAGRAPFEGATDWALLRAVSEEEPPSLHGLRKDVTPAVESLVSRALTKNVTARYQTASELHDDAMAILAKDAQPTRVQGSSRILLRAALVMVVVGAVGAWFALGVAHRSWARGRAVVEIDSLYGADLHLPGFLLLTKAEGYLPNDTALARVALANTSTIAVFSSPAGANVEIQDYLAPNGDWLTLGRTPLTGIRVPKGYFRWRVTVPGAAATLRGRMVRDTVRFVLDSTAVALPGMVHVPAAVYGDYIDFMGWVGPYRLPAFDIDQFEVTNAAYQQFVDSGGYRERRFWHETFVDHGHVVSWDDAMTRFRDQSGRVGPSTWTGGHFADGQGNFPVGGISWYEAAAYAAFRGKELPVLAQWHQTAPPNVSRYIGRVSNMSHEHVAPVGAYPGVGPYGTYDMAGNVREWVLNDNVDGNRFILGGAWSSPRYLYDESEALPPFDRSPSNGMRAVRNLGPLPGGAAQTVTMLRRDFAAAKPATDPVFHAYELSYAYDESPLNAKVDSAVARTPEWRVERITFDAAYRRERMAAYLYLPAHVKPPYQAVVFFPSARVLGLRSSAELGDTEFFDYVVQSGRAVLYPVFQDTYERRQRGLLPGASTTLQLFAERSKDLQRSLDYLQSRPDIDHARLGYLGVSMGAAEGVIYVEQAQRRLRTAVFLDGGFFLDQPVPGGDQVDFAPRLRLPVLMVNGRYDATFGYETAQLPLLRMLGAPDSAKRHVVLETSHDVTTERPRLVKEVRSWLDRYLGRIDSR